MAEVAEMGEVDEMHSKDEGNVVLNGDVREDVDMESQESQDSLKVLKKNNQVELMDAEESDNETGDTKEGNQESESSSSEDSCDNSEHTAPDSSAATESQSIENEDASSQETKASESQIDESENEERKCDPEDKEKNESDEKTSKSGDAEVESKVDNVHNNDSENKSEKEDINEIEETKETEEIHEIDDDDDSHKNDTIELNDSCGEDGDGDVMIVDDGPKQNGTGTPSEVIDLDETPEKDPSSPKEVIAPRRSSRNLNKNKSYAEIEKEETPPPLPQDEEDEDDDSEESDIEEVLPQDPLAVSDSITVEKIPSDKSKQKDSSTIVVKDTKRLVEIASKSSNGSQNKKEPTLVIIDTNSILSGRGPVPVTNKPPPVTTSFPSVLPMALPAQGMYPPNMRATITPIPMNSTSLTPTPTLRVSTPAASITPSTPLLPTLTDDMFVVEAPSFIVPYVYEKPPVKDFKDFVKEIRQQILDDRKKEKEERKKKKEEEKKKQEEEKKKQEEENKEEGDKTEGEKDKKKEEEEEDDSDDDVVSADEDKKEEPQKPYSYFDSPLGKFFTEIGYNMVQEYVQADLLKQQKRKREREGGSNPETDKTISSLIKNLEYSKENNEAFKMQLKKCEFCNFKTESKLAMAYHLETPHMKNFIYKCNFCSYEVRSPHDILFHMEAEHAVRGHLERAPAFHQCPNCPFEDNQKGKLSRHLVTCMRKFKPERNLEPPVDWEPPAKIPRLPKIRQAGLNATAAAYQAMSKTNQYQFLSKMQLQQASVNALQRGRGRPSLPPVQPQKILRPPGMVFKQQPITGGGSVLVPTNYQLSGNQVFQNANQGKKLSSQPSISITPLPRGTSATPTSPAVTAKPGDTNSKNSFVICEICDGYIKDLEQLRNHMQWIHKIKIHPKMIYNRPPLNCQKCQFRFFTDQGLERHLLGTHGLVTSSMQEAANKSKDSGRCPVCGRVYQWKLLNHVARDHSMTLKPAHLSYKCTVCTATFGMYKQFENHVYSAHSVVAKRVMDKKAASSSPTTNKATTDNLKPLKINDEITIIPQPAKPAANGASKESNSASSSRSNTPSTSKNVDNATPGTSSASSRAERLARRNANDSD